MLFVLVCQYYCHEYYSSHLIFIFNSSDVEEKGFNVRLTVVDTPGFGDYMNNQDCWVPIIDFLDDQHHNYMKSESSGARKGIADVRVHACLYFVQPSGHTLKPLDIEVMKHLGSRVNLIPVVAKADTLTPKDLALFKERVGILLAQSSLSCQLIIMAQLHYRFAIVSEFTTSTTIVLLLTRMMTRLLLLPKASSQLCPSLSLQAKRKSW